MSEPDEARLLRDLTGNPLSNPTRLAIALYLLPRRGAYFITIAKDLGLTPGNLRYHLDSMIRDGLVEEKYVFGERPRKYIQLTVKGSMEVKRILELLKTLAKLQGSGRINEGTRYRDP